MKKDTKLYLGLVIIILAIIITIYVLKGNNNQPTDEETIKCIAEKSKIIVSPTCGWCTKQKEDLGEYLDLFEFIDIVENPEISNQYDITGTPTWIINEQIYPGYKTINELKQITGC